MPAIEPWLLGVHVYTLSWTPLDLAADGTLTDDAGGAISLVGHVDEIGMEFPKTEENISPMHRLRANWVTTETDMTFVFTEVLKTGAANLLAAIYFASAWSEYGRVVVVRGLGTFTAILKASDYREGPIGKRKNTAVLRARMVDDITPGSLNPEYS